MDRIACAACLALHLDARPHACSLHFIFGSDGVRDAVEGRLYGSGRLRISARKRGASSTHQ